MDLDERLHRLLTHGGGIVTRAQLRSIGVTEARLQHLLAAGRLVRHRRGWYRDPIVALSDAGKARAIGGALTCVSALAEHGFWVPPRLSGAPHLRVTQTRHAPGYFTHCSRAAPLPSSGVDDVPTAVLTAQWCLELDELVAVLDTAANRGFSLTPFQQLTPASAKLRRALSLGGYRADSAIESLVRVRLQQLRVQFRTHVRIGPYEFDLLIGGFLAVELDGFAYHSGQAALQRDRAKDRFCALNGLTLLRFTYWDVVERWPQCEAELLRLLRARRPRHPTSRLLAEQTKKNLG